MSGERHCGRKKQRPNKPLFILSFRGCAPPSSHEGVGCVRCILVDKSLLLCYNIIALVGRKPKVGSICGPTERSSYNAEMGLLEGCRGCEASHLTVRFAGGHFFMLSAGDRRAHSAPRRRCDPGVRPRSGTPLKCATAYIASAGRNARINPKERHAGHGVLPNNKKVRTTRIRTPIPQSG